MSEPVTLQTNQKDITTFPHFGSRPMFKEFVDPVMKRLIDALASKGVGHPCCRFPACSNEHGLEHICGPKHWSQLWQWLEPRKAIPLDSLREAWQIWNVYGGTIAFNHISGAVEVWGSEVWSCMISAPALGALQISAASVDSGWGGRQPPPPPPTAMTGRTPAQQLPSRTAPDVERDGEKGDTNDVCFFRKPSGLDSLEECIHEIRDRAHREFSMGYDIEIVIKRKKKVETMGQQPLQMAAHAAVVEVASTPTAASSSPYPLNEPNVCGGNGATTAAVATTATTTSPQLFVPSDCCPPGCSQAAGVNGGDPRAFTVDEQVEAAFGDEWLFCKIYCLLPNKMVTVQWSSDGTITDLALELVRRRSAAVPSACPVAATDALAQQAQLHASPLVTNGCGVGAPNGVVPNGCAEVGTNNKQKSRCDLPFSVNEEV